MANEEPVAVAEESAAPAAAPERAPASLAVLVAATVALCLATAAPVLDSLWQIAAVRLGIADGAPAYDYVWMVLNALPELRVQLGVVGVLVGLAATAFGYRTSALVALFCTAVNLGAIVQSIDAVPAAPSEGPTLRVMTFNLNAFNTTRGATVDAIRAANADVVVVQEASEGWPRALEPLRRDYRYVAPAEVAASQGMMILSRVPLAQIRQLQPISEYYPYLTATLQLPSAAVTLLSIHPPRPLRLGESVDRDIYFARVAQHVRSLDGPVIVAGDFTATPWSRAFAELTRGTGLIKAWSLRPWLSTWPSWLPSFGIPIDHILANGRLAIVDVRLGDSGGSDHFPVIATLRLRPQ
ncbi:MAG TPA: endonuclease/exonuclease/phosphatase family protein [Alphaproteobacteria bacterium]|nr:endonuclease/exonuclease/phosphatase family protein [Alphaproteobacteria bacterium]